MSGRTSLSTAASCVADEQLARLAASGSTAAFDELSRRYSHRLAGYATRIVDDWAVGEDVAQASLRTAHRALRRGSAPTHVRPWLYRIALDAALDARGLRGGRLPAENPLLRALWHLPDRERRVYLLREVHGLPMVEIGRELELAPSRVEQALFAARARVAELLSIERPGDPGRRPRPAMVRLATRLLGRPGR